MGENFSFFLGVRSSGGGWWRRQGLGAGKGQNSLDKASGLAFDCGNALWLNEKAHLSNYRLTIHRAEAG